MPNNREAPGGGNPQDVFCCPYGPTRDWKRSLVRKVAGYCPPNDEVCIVAGDLAWPRFVGLYGQDGDVIGCSAGTWPNKPAVT